MLLPSCTQSYILIDLTYLIYWSDLTTPCSYWDAVETQTQEEPVAPEKLPEFSSWGSVVQRLGQRL